MSQIRQQLSTLQESLQAMAAGKTTSQRALDFTSPTSPPVTKGPEEAATGAAGAAGHG